MANPRYRRWLENDNLILIQGWKRNGLTDEQIAHNMGVNPRTLERWKKDHSQICRALKIGREQANFIVESELFKKAVKGNTTAMIFFLKNNWRDKYNDSQLSPEEREQAKARTRKLLADARISEAKAKIVERLDQEDNEQLDAILDKLVKEAEADGTKRSDDTEAD
jgi:transcriptional regulator with XRE-family HTH domain